MAFDLKIEFVGLCLFVPDYGSQTMYVLMPHAGTAGGQGRTMPPHAVRLCFNAAYLQPGSTRLWEAVTLVVMDGAELSLPPGPAELELPDELVNVGAVANRPIDTVALSADPAAKLTARALLRSGKYLEHDGGGYWKYPSESSPPRQLPNRICWTVPGMEGDRLDLACAEFGGEPVLDLPSLYPIDGTIEVSVYHTPHEELPPLPVNPPRPAQGAEAYHFAAYYELFDPPVVGGPLPTYAGFLQLPPGQVFFGGSPYTCMAAQSPLTPES